MSHFEGLHILVNDHENAEKALVELNEVAGAKLKLDELFVMWLSLKPTADLINTLVADAEAGKPLLTGPASHTASLSSLSKSVLSPVRDSHSPPPRSPTRSPAHTPESKSPRSPQHFTFGELGGPPGSPELSPMKPTALPFPFVDGEMTEGAGAGAGGSALSSASPGDKSHARGPPGAESGAGAAASASAADSKKKTTLAGSHASTDVCPVFYHAGAGGRGRGHPLAGETLTDKLPAILEVWRRNQPEPMDAEGSRPSAGDAAAEGLPGVTSKDMISGLPVEQFAAVAKTLCGFPSFFAAPLFRRVRLLYDPAHSGTKAARFAAQRSAATEFRQPPAFEESIDTEGTVSLKLFLQYWKDEMEPFDHFDRFFRLVSQPGSRGIYLRDFMPLLEELLAFHPGLAFLEGTPEFQEKYARTVIARIFYMLDPLARGFIDIRSLRRSNLLHAFHTVDMEEDINLVNDYFSYEHFYVLYCRYWEQDTDRDFLLTRSDLNRMDNLTHAVLDRVFAQAGRRFTSGVPDRMGYEDFICFLLSEEDKTNIVSLGYWFRVVDLNGDGKITPDEMKYFYTEQMQRMADLNLEVVPFEDILAQMTDLLQPDKDGEFEFKDFIHPSRIRLTGVFFSILFNLQKFTLFEQRDPVIVKQELNQQGITQWDRYAQFEYMKLAEEEENGMDEELSMELEGMTMGEVNFRGDEDA